MLRFQSGFPHLWVTCTSTGSWGTHILDGSGGATLERKALYVFRTKERPAVCGSTFSSTRTLYSLGSEGVPLLALTEAMW